MALKLMNDGVVDEPAKRDATLYNHIVNGDFIFKGIGNEFKTVYSTLSLLVTVQSDLRVFIADFLFGYMPTA